MKFSEYAGEQQKYCKKTKKQRIHAPEITRESKIKEKKILMYEGIKYYFGRNKNILTQQL